MENKSTSSDSLIPRETLSLSLSLSLSVFVCFILILIVYLLIINYLFNILNIGLILTAKEI